MKQSARRDRPFGRAVSRRGDHASQVSIDGRDDLKLLSILMEWSNAGCSDAVATGSGTLANNTGGTIQAPGGSVGEWIITGTPVNHAPIDVASEANMSIAGTLFDPAKVVVNSTHSNRQSDLPSTGFLNQGTV